MTAPRLKYGPSKPRGVVHLAPIDDLAARKQQVRDLIARRAYELYEQRGCTHGHDREDWSRAASEVLCTAPVGYLQSHNTLTIDIGVSGFSAEDLRVQVEPLRIIISREKPTDPTMGGRCQKRERPLELFQAIDLPVEIDPASVVANFRSGVLELTMAKAHLAEVLREQSRTAAA